MKGIKSTFPLRKGVKHSQPVKKGGKRHPQYMRLGLGPLTTSMRIPKSGLAHKLLQSEARRKRAKLGN